MLFPSSQMRMVTWSPVACLAPHSKGDGRAQASATREHELKPCAYREANGSPSRRQPQPGSRCAMVRLVGGRPESPLTFFTAKKRGLLRQGAQIIRWVEGGRNGGWKDGGWMGDL